MGFYDVVEALVTVAPLRSQRMNLADRPHIDKVKVWMRN